ncbi:MAG: PilT/PilU family type 4a pilus ATPase [Planctomycetota bacterium]|jgi:twitching motility protein PilT
MSEDVQVDAGRRQGNRSAVAFPVEVRGTTGTYQAETLNVSPSGTLIRITDPAFATEEIQADFVSYTERAAEELQEMRLRFEGRAVVRHAEVVRMTPDVDGPPLIACRFLKPLRASEAERLDVEMEPEETDTPAAIDERRTAPRVDRIFYGQVSGEAGTYRAHILNLSFSGALLTITDHQLAVPREPDKLIAFTKRLGLQFQNGMRVRILEGDVSVESDVVRLAERTIGDDTMILIGVRFRRALDQDECRHLDIPAPDAPVAAPEPVSNDAPTTRIGDIMRQATSAGATDLHVKAGVRPRIRLGGRLQDLGGEAVTPAEAHAMAMELLTADQATELENTGDVELVSALPGSGRFRVNVFRQRGLTGMALRCIPTAVPTLEQLGFDASVAALVDEPRGLVLVAGTTGSGRSATLAAMVDHINRTRPCHILTLESPIEYLYEDRKAHITQREIGCDAQSYACGLRRALRQDPDVIVLGELVTTESIALAIQAASTDHLVLAPVRTRWAPAAIERLVEAFPASEQERTRRKLAAVLQGVTAQCLLPRSDGRGLVAAQETLRFTSEVRRFVREGESGRLFEADGLIAIEESLNALVAAGAVEYDAALAKAHRPERIDKL